METGDFIKLKNLLHISLLFSLTVRLYLLYVKLKSSICRNAFQNHTLNCSQQPLMKQMVFNMKRSEVFEITSATNPSVMVMSTHRPRRVRENLLTALKEGRKKKEVEDLTMHRPNAVRDSSGKLF